MSWLLILLAVLTAWLCWRLKNKRLLAMAKVFPGPPALPFVGNAGLFMVQPEELASVVESLMKNYGSALRFWLGPDLNIVVSDPDDVRLSKRYPFDPLIEFLCHLDPRHVLLKLLLTSSKTNFKGPQYKYMSDVIGGGILSGSGPKWRNHRKLATPNYGKRAVESYNNIVNQEIDYLMERLRADAVNERGRSSNIYKQIVKTTSYTVCQTLMGLSREQTLGLPHLQEIIDISPKMYDAVFDRMTKWYLQIDPVFWLSDQYATLKTFIETFTTFSTAIVQHREEVLKDNKEELRKLVVSNEDSTKNTELSVVDRFILSQEMDAEELSQETFTIFTSSQEASAKISASIILMMAHYPECQEKLYEEIRSVIGDEDRWISDKDLKRMPYMDMVFSEAVRMFPIGALIQRTIKEDFTISSGTLPAGCSFMVPIYHIQRDPRIWKDPDTFDPERFTPENIKMRQPNCYLPFSWGPMDCLGRHFGMKMIKMICVRVLKEFQVTTTESCKDLKMTIAISASPLNGYNVILNRRK